MLPGTMGWFIIFLLLYIGAGFLYFRYLQHQPHFGWESVLFTFLLFTSPFLAWQILAFSHIGILTWWYFPQYVDEAIPILLQMILVALGLTGTLYFTFWIAFSRSKRQYTTRYFGIMGSLIFIMGGLGWKIGGYPPTKAGEPLTWHDRIPAIVASLIFLGLFVGPIIMENLPKKPNQEKDELIKRIKGMLNDR